MCICVTVFLMLQMVCKFGIVFLKLVSLDFKTSWKMFTQRGGVCNQVNLCHFHMGNLDLAFCRTEQRNYCTGK